MCLIQILSACLFLLYVSPGKIVTFTHCDEESKWYTLNMNTE